MQTILLSLILIFSVSLYYIIKFGKPYLKNTPYDVLWFDGLIAGTIQLGVSFFIGTYIDNYVFKIEDWFFPVVILSTILFVVGYGIISVKNQNSSPS